MFFADGRYFDSYLLNLIPPDILGRLIERCRRSSGFFDSELSNSEVVCVTVPSAR